MGAKSYHLLVIVSSSAVQLLKLKRGSIWDISIWAHEVREPQSRRSGRSGIGANVLPTARCPLGNRAALRHRLLEGLFRARRIAGWRAVSSTR